MERPRTQSQEANVYEGVVGEPMPTAPKVHDRLDDLAR